MASTESQTDINSKESGADLEREQFASNLAEGKRILEYLKNDCITHITTNARVVKSYYDKVANANEAILRTEQIL